MFGLFILWSDFSDHQGRKYTLNALTSSRRIEMLKYIPRYLNRFIAAYRTSQEDLQWQSEIADRYFEEYWQYLYCELNSTESYMLDRLAHMYADVGKSA